MADKLPPYFAPGHYEPGSGLPCKARSALESIQDHPEKWFRGKPIDDRDRALLSAPRLPWIQYGQCSYLRKVYTLGRGIENRQMINWTVEEDKALKALLCRGGVEVVGFDNTEIPRLAPPHEFSHVTVNVNIEGKAGAGFNWGFLSTHGLQPGNVRIFKGPTSTCRLHPWDAMILRSCTANTDGLRGTIADSRWDILCMKMCEDYDSPWLVVSIHNVSEHPYEVPGVGDCGCCCAAQS